MVCSGVPMPPHDADPCNCLCACLFLGDDCPIVPKGVGVPLLMQPFLSTPQYCLMFQKILLGCSHRRAVCRWPSGWVGRDKADTPISATLTLWSPPGLSDPIMLGRQDWGNIKLDPTMKAGRWEMWVRPETRRGAFWVWRPPAFQCLHWRTPSEFQERDHLWLPQP